MYKKVIGTILLVILAVAVFASCEDVPSANAAADEKVAVPILMYHRILKSRKGRYIVSPEQFEADLVMLKNEGYESITTKQLINFVEGRGSLPSKPVMITFDDGHYDNLYYGESLLKKHGFTAVLSIVGAFSEYSSTSGDHSNPNYSHITWEQIKDANERATFEFSNHTYNLHKLKPRYGIVRKKDEDRESYKDLLRTDILRLQDKFGTKCNITTNVFAFPFGKYSSEATEILKSLGFKVMFTCNEKINYIGTGDCDKLCILGRFNREGSYSTSKVQKLICTSTTPVIY